MDLQIHNKIYICLQISNVLLFILTRIRANQSQCFFHELKIL